MRFCFPSALVFGLSTVSLAACSGGEILGINSHPAPTTPDPKTSPTASPQPISSATASIAEASGSVVDLDTNQPVAGIQIQIRSSSQSLYSIVATTESDGTFSFSTQPGIYVIAIGSNNAADTTRATEHDLITLSSGKNALSPIEPLAVADYSLLPSQSSGKFRLAQLSATEQSCLSGMNSGRSSNSLPLLIEDEEELEYTRAELAEEIAQGTDQPAPMFSSGATSFEKPDGLSEVSTYSGLTPCSAYSDGYTFGNGVSPGNAFAFDESTTWYAGTSGSDGSNIYEVQSFGIDQIQSTTSASGMKH